MVIRASRLATLQRIIAVLSLGFVAAIVVASLSCAPTYFQRADVVLLLLLAVADAVLLLDAASGDSDRHRAVGVAASASVAAIFVATFSIPILLAPIAGVGAFRFPRSPAYRRAMTLVIPAAILVTAGAVVVGTSLVTPEQFRCP